MEGLIGVLILGLIIYLILRYPLRKMSLGFKILFTLIFACVGLLVLFLILGYLVHLGAKSE
ncbi:MAG: hypothetical protein CFH41_02566 [Alphaproteobacteria bacterium MarineAlpha11_Bin1]|nr:MAG: hypothetical protein CFH41_02566 [Alphaproteobacteria bacterium MarineAlpha11_Bin1]